MCNTIDSTATSTTGDSSVVCRKTRSFNCSANVYLLRLLDVLIFQIPMVTARAIVYSDKRTSNEEDKGNLSKSPKLVLDDIPHIQSLDTHNGCNHAVVVESKPLDDENTGISTKKSGNYSGSNQRQADGLEVRPAILNHRHPSNMSVCSASKDSWMGLKVPRCVGTGSRYKGFMCIRRTRSDQTSRSRSPGSP